MNLPERFTEEMKRLLGGEYSAWLESFQTDGQDGEGDFRGRRPEADDAFRGLRVNTRKLSPQEFLGRASFSLRPVPWTENGFYLEGGRRASRHPYYAAGLYYLQEPSAMVPAAALPSNGATGCWISARLREGRPRSLRPGLQARASLVGERSQQFQGKGPLKKSGAVRRGKYSGDQRKPGAALSAISRAFSTKSSSTPPAPARGCSEKILP